MVEHEIHPANGYSQEGSSNANFSTACSFCVCGLTTYNWSGKAPVIQYYCKWVSHMRHEINADSAYLFAITHNTKMVR